jgi:ABC-type branched-subunit amino acid transport system ATPase component/branched-subunit amino acid ABC-type transport system permease component
MTEFAGLVISGLVGGGLASMIAVSLVMTYTTTGIFNISQGSVAFLAAFAFLELHQAAGLPTLVAAAITVLVIAPLLGLLLEGGVFRRLSTAPELARIVGTVGLALAIPAFVVIVITYLGDVPAIASHLVTIGQANAIPLGPDPSIHWNIGAGVVVNSDEVIVLGFTAVTAIGYWYLLRRTRLGLEMRAVVDGHSLATIRGVSQARVSRLAWTLSFSSAALVGVCGSISLGLDPNTYLLLLFIAAAAVVVGGMRSVPWAFGGALLLGVVQNLVSGYLQRGPLAQVNGLGSAVPFIVLLAGLYAMSRRRGRVAGTGSTASDAPVELTRERRTLPQRTQTIVLWIIVALLIQFVFGEYWNQFVAEGLCMSIIFLSFVVITGQVGVVSLAQAGFVTCGGLLAGWLAGTYGLPLWAAAIIAIAAAVVAGVLTAIPALRLGGLPLALGTLALAFLFDQLVFEIPVVQGPNGGGWFIPRPAGGAFSFVSNTNFSLLLLVVLAVFILLVRNFQLSQTGRSALAIRGSRPGAITSGVSIARPVLVAFGLSALIAGVGGFFYAQTLGQITSTSNPPLNALLWVTIAISIGIRRPAGAILAGMSASIIPQLLTYVTTSTQWPQLVFGFGAVVLAKYPGGTLDLQIEQLKWLRDHIFPARFVDSVRAFYLGSRPTGPAAVIAADGTVVAVSSSGSDLPGIVLDEQAPVVDEPVVLDEPAVAGEEPAVAAAGPLIVVSALEEEAPALALETPTLAISGLRAGYGDLEVLHGIDLVARPGKITALFGANGAGKSTLCSTLAGLVAATGGDLMLDGERVTQMSGLDRLRNGIFVIQESRSIFPDLTVEENLRIPLRTQERVEEALAQSAELRSRRRLRAGMLSGGEQQLLAMAPALVMQPKLLIADEPNLGLAPQARQRVLGVCQTLRDRGAAVLLIEERPGDVFDVADEIVLLRLGHVDWQRPKAAVSADILVDSYLAVRHQ